MSGVVPLPSLVPPKFFDVSEDELVGDPLFSGTTYWPLLTPTVRFVSSDLECPSEWVYDSIRVFVSTHRLLLNPERFGRGDISCLRPVNLLVLKWVDCSWQTRILHSLHLFCFHSYWLEVWSILGPSLSSYDSSVRDFPHDYLSCSFGLLLPYWRSTP